MANHHHIGFFFGFVSPPLSFPYRILCFCPLFVLFCFCFVFVFLIAQAFFDLLNASPNKFGKCWCKTKCRHDYRFSWRVWKYIAAQAEENDQGNNRRLLLIVIIPVALIIALLSIIACYVQQKVLKSKSDSTGYDSMSTAYKIGFTILDMNKFTFFDSLIFLLCRKFIMIKEC